MKLIKTIEKIIQESEEQYIRACKTCAPIKELDRLEKQYNDSLKLLKVYNTKQKKNSN